MKILINFYAFICIFFMGILIRHEIHAQSSFSTQNTFQNIIEHKEEIINWMLSLDGKRSDRAGFSCGACKLAIETVINFIDEGHTQQEVAQALINVCIEVQAFNNETCQGIGLAFVPTTYFIYTERHFLTTDDICGVISQAADCGFVVNDTLSDWNIMIDPFKPPLINLPPLPQDLPTVKVLQLTDVHLDLNYVDGSLADCASPFLCCLGGTPENSSQAAGHYGDYQCDFPEIGMNIVFEDSASRYTDYSFVLLTGDYVHHAIWATGIQENTKHITAVAQSIKKIFGNTQVIPVFGNHEPHPCNMFSPSSLRGTGSEFDLSWLYDTMTEMYKDYLPPDALESFQKAGFYSLNPQEGLRVVVLNTNLCYTLNFWLFYNTVDPEGQLQWFADVMLAAEEAGESVIVVGHVPPGHGQCFSRWSALFTEIINRFEGIIKAQFYGHTHEDDFKLFFDNSANTPRPTNSLFIGASVTPLTNLNPGYKVYHFDGLSDDHRNATWEMVDHETFIYNLTAANLESETPTLYRLYSAKSEYGLDSLRPADLYDFVLKMAENETLFQTFYRHFNKDSDVMELCDDSDCKLKRLCEIVTSDIKDLTQCEMLSNIINKD